MKTYILWRNRIHWQCVLDGNDIDACWAQSTVVFQPRYCITCWSHWYFFKWSATTTSRLTFVQCESKRKFFQFGEFYLQNWNKIIMIPFFIIKYYFSSSQTCKKMFLLFSCCWRLMTFGWKQIKCGCPCFFWLVKHDLSSFPISWSISWGILWKLSPKQNTKVN